MISIKAYGRRKSVELAILDVPSGEFGDAADACRDYCLKNEIAVNTVCWNWADSAWERKR